MVLNLDKDQRVNSKNLIGKGNICMITRPIKKLKEIWLNRQIKIMIMIKLKKLWINIQVRNLKENNNSNYKMKENKFQVQKKVLIILAIINLKVKTPNKNLKVEE